MRTGMRTRRVVEVVFVVDAQQRNQNFIKIRTREPSLYMYVRKDTLLMTSTLNLCEVKRT